MVRILHGIRLGDSDNGTPSRFGVGNVLYTAFFVAIDSCGLGGGRGVFVQNSFKLRR